MIRDAYHIDEHTPWQEMTPGGEIYQPGTSRAVHTGFNSINTFWN